MDQQSAFQGGWNHQMSQKNSTQYHNYHSRPNQPQQRLYQKNGMSPATRRYSSGISSNPQQTGNGFEVPQMMQNSKKGNNKGTYRSATFHQQNNNPFMNARQSQLNQQQSRIGGGGQLRTSSSFHGSLQSQPNMVYSGRNSHSGVLNQSGQKTSTYANVSGQFGDGMKDVPIWLKGLRLHKYTRMFQEMSYDEMMALTDQQLEHRQVTKGARKKILQSLANLRDRSQLIKQLETCIDEHGDVRCLIVEMRAMMFTPIAPYRPKPDEGPKPSNYMIDAIGIPGSEVSDENLPGHIARLCIRLHEFLFSNGLPKIHELGIEDDYLIKLLQIYDKICSNEAFTYRQKHCINECKRVLFRYMKEQKILLSSQHDSLSAPYSSPSNQPTLVSSPSSGYHSTRRNSDSDTNSDPASPPVFHPHVYQTQQQTVSNCPPPGFEWPVSNGNTVATKPAAASLAHFQPYVDNDLIGLGQQSGWYSMQQSNEQQPVRDSNHLNSGRNNQWDSSMTMKEDRNLFTTFIEGNPALYSCLLQHLQQQQRQHQAEKPSKPISPIGTRATNFIPQQMNSDEVQLPSTVTDKLKFIAKEDRGPEALEIALQIAMDQLKLQKQKESLNGDGYQQPTFFQNVKDLMIPAQQPQNNYLWSSAACSTPKPLKQTFLDERRSSGSGSFLNNDFNFKNKIDYFDLWTNSASQDLSSSDQLTGSTTSTNGSDNLFGVVKPQQKTQDQFDSNMLNRMLADTHICGQSQQQQRIMRQYAPDDILMIHTNQGPFLGMRPEDNLRNVINEQKQLFDTFRPLYTASGAVH